MLYGLLCVALTFLVATFGNLVQASLTIFGMLGGPVLAVFILGMLTTRANEKVRIIISFFEWAIIGYNFSVVSFGKSSVLSRVNNFNMLHQAVFL